MAIDPQTHKPISLIDDTHLSQKDQNRRKSQRKQTPPQPSPPKELKNEVASDETNIMNLIIDGFCTEEVPLIEPHEILIPSASCSSTATTSYSSSSTSTSSLCSNSESAANLLQDLANEFPEFEWPNIFENGIVEELLQDDFGSTWDFVANNYGFL